MIIIKTTTEVGSSINVLHNSARAAGPDADDAQLLESVWDKLHGAGVARVRIHDHPCIKVEQQDVFGGVVGELDLCHDAAAHSLGRV